MFVGIATECRTRLHPHLRAAFPHSLDPERTVRLLRSRRSTGRRSVAATRPGHRNGDRAHAECPPLLHERRSSRIDFRARLFL